MKNLNLTMSMARVCSAAAVLSLAGAAMGQSAPDAPTPPTPPSPPTPMNSLVTSWSMSQSVDGKSVTVSGKDGKVTAEIDGKVVPQDRISQRGSTVRIKDDKGETVFESEAPGGVGSANLLAPRVRTRVFSSIPSGRGGSLTFGDPDDRTIHVAEAPKVMVGVQLLEPDSSLRGHLGLKDDESTLISAVYEGLAASQSGLEPYDIIVAVNGKTPASPEVVRKALRETEAGKAVALDVLHHGQRKTVSVTVEKYDGEKLERAKVNAIAAASDNMSQFAIAGSPGNGSWSWGGGGANPFVATIPGAPGQPGKSITLWGRSGQEQEEMAKRLREMAERAQEQASKADEQARRLHDQLSGMMGGGGGAGGKSMMDMNKVMEERMKRMEEMMQKMMEQRNAPGKKDDGKS